MADNTSPEPPATDEKNEDPGENKDNPETKNEDNQQDDQTKEGQATEEGKKTEAGPEKSVQLTEIRSTPSRKREEKPPIADDFFYDVEELWCKPYKSDETLPDDLVTLYHSFGYACHMRHNLLALDGDKLAFSAGAFLQIVHHGSSPFEHGYMPTTGGGSVGPLVMHPHGELFAVGEKGSNPVVNIFTVEDYQLHRILRGGTTVAYTSLAFNDSGELLATQGGDPDFMLTVWNWKQEAILLRCKSFSQEVNHVSFNKELQGALTTAGLGHIKMWNMARTFTGLKLQGSVGRFGRTAISDIEGYIEFPDGKVLSGSDWGNMLLWDENLIKLQIGRKGGKNCHQGHIMHMMMVEGEIITAGLDGYVRSWNFELIDVLEAAEQSGLVEIEPMNEVLVGTGVQLYHLTQPKSAGRSPSLHKPPSSLGRKHVEGEEEKGAEEGEHEPEKKASEKLESSRGERTMSRSGGHHGTKDQVLAETPSTTERHTWYCQDGAGGIWKADLSFRLAAMAPLKILDFHGGPIVACAVSPVTHLVTTLGHDGTLRLYDFLNKQLLAVRQFKARGSALAWVPVCVDNKCATVMAGFSDGGVRRVSIAGATTTMFGRDRMECQLTLVQALKPHEQKVTALAYSYNNDSKNLTTLVTCSEDRTVFFFRVQTRDLYTPLCFVVLDHIPRAVHWSPEQATTDYLLVTCDDGFLVEMIQPLRVNQTETFQCDDVLMRVYQFTSVKSEMLHEEELAMEDEIKAKQEEERKERNQMLLVRQVETPSQQELRIEQEDAAALALQKAKEEEGEAWKPYIPPVPSPILQTVYTEGKGKFWLTMGDYDAGYLYECSFSLPFSVRGEGEGEGEEARPVDRTKPLSAKRVEGDLNTPISALCFNSEGSCVFFGMQNGRVRLQFLETEGDLAAPRFHYSFGAHDTLHGAVTGMCLSHDEAFLITVGADGNFFIFALLPIDQLLQEMSSSRAKLPTTTEEKPANDLVSQQYTIEQAKQKSDYDRMVMLAERSKQEKRLTITGLRTKFKQLLNQNAALPARHRLTPSEFLMDQSRFLDIEKEKEKKLEELKKQTAWDSEKADLGHRKLHNHYRRYLTWDRFCVKAINTDHVIYSYRTESMGTRKMTMRQSRSSYVSRPPDMDDDDKMSGSDAEMDEELKRLLEAKETASQWEAISARIAYLLRKVQEKQLKRAKRKIVWRKFLQTKPSDDYEDPADVAAIQTAVDNLGLRFLKSDQNYHVPDSYRLTMADGTLRLHSTEKYLLRLQIEFNEKLIDLREEKIRTLAAIDAECSRMQDVQDRLDISSYQIIPQCPLMTQEEKPGGVFSLDADQAVRLKQDVRRKLARRRSTMVGPGSPRRESLFTNKSTRKSSVVIAKENFIRRKSQSNKHGESNLGVAQEALASASHLVKMRDRFIPEESMSDLEKEIRAVEHVELSYQQDVLIKSIQDKKDRFDIQHRLLRHEKLALDVLCKVTQLQVTTLQEEQLILMECENVEDSIQANIDRCLEQKYEIDKALKQLLVSANKLNKEAEELGNKEKALFAELETIIGESNPFHDFLVKVFKKKVKRKKLQNKQIGEDDDSSQSESDSSEDDEESDEEEDDAVHYDLGSCPPQCSEAKFSQVVELREQRLDLDEQVVEVKRSRDAVQKEMDGGNKKRQATEVTLGRAQQELVAFQLQKQQRVNALDVVTRLHLHQLQSLKRNGELTFIGDLLCLDEEELLRLHRRIGELRQEKVAEKKQTVARRRQNNHLQHERRRFLERLEEAEEMCKKEMVKKFGQTVDMEVLETVVADPQIEDVRGRLICYQLQCDRQMKELNTQLAHIHELNNDSIRVDSLFKNLESSMKSERLHLERNLDASIKCRMLMDADQIPVPKDMGELAELVDQQQEDLNALKAEIKLLHGNAPSLE